MKKKKFLIGTLALFTLVFAFSVSSYATETPSLHVEFSGPVDSFVSTGSNDAVLYTFSLIAEEDILVKDPLFSMMISTDFLRENGGFLDLAGNPNFTDIKLIDVDTGGVIGTPVDSSTFRVDPTFTGTYIPITEAYDSTQLSYFLIRGTLEMEAEETLKLALTADIANQYDLDLTTVVANLEINSSLPSLASPTAGRLDNSTAISPNSRIAGYPVLIRY